MFFSFLYEIVLLIAALIYTPKLIYDYFVRKKYQRSLTRRLGFNFPLIDKGKKSLIWIHAVSVGETKAIASLLKTIRQELDQPIIVVSSITETGHAEAKRSLGIADYHVYLPFDFRFIIRPIIKRASPDLVILSETDFWYNFLHAAKDSGSIIALVNGKISDRSFKRFKKYPYFSNKIFSCFDLLCIQSNHYLERFKALGIDENKLKITGNLKFDDEYASFTDEQRETWKNQFQLHAENQIVVVGSSHDPEEKLILEQFKRVWSELPHVKLILVPRHPERFNNVAALLEKENIPYARFSQLDSNLKNAKVVLVDAMGLLRKCYQLADLAIVAGSYISRVGGHNILEPSWYGVPVIYGPFMHSQPELLELSENYGAGLQIPMEDLGKEVVALLKDSSKRLAIGQKGLQMLNDVKGATQKTWETLQQFFNINLKGS